MPQEQKPPASAGASLTALFLAYGAIAGAFTLSQRGCSRNEPAAITQPAPEPATPQAK